MIIMQFMILDFIQNYYPQMRHSWNQNTLMKVVFQFIWVKIMEFLHDEIFYSVFICGIIPLMKSFILYLSVTLQIKRKIVPKLLNSQSNSLELLVSFVLFLKISLEEDAKISSKVNDWFLEEISKLEKQCHSADEMYYESYFVLFLVSKDNHFMTFSHEAA